MPTTAYAAMIWTYKADQLASPSTYNEKIKKIKMKWKRKTGQTTFCGIGAIINFNLYVMSQQSVH